VNEKNQLTQEWLYSEERKSIRNHQKSGKTAEKYGETEATKRSNKQFQIHPLLPRSRREY
jgi:hypothetical protein